MIFVSFWHLCVFYSVIMVTILPHKKTQIYPKRNQKSAIVPHRKIRNQTGSAKQIQRKEIL